MPARNRDHDAVVAALVADGWTITDDPLTIGIGDRAVFVDLGAERLPLGAEKDGRRIAVEVQGFGSPSAVADLQRAMGQFLMYRDLLSDAEPDRTLFLAVPATVYDGILSEALGVRMIARYALRVVQYDPEGREPLRWTS